MKTHLRRIRDAAKAGKNDEVVKLLPAAYKAIDTAAKKRLINRKNADRKKSAIALLIKRGS
jgi:ribosomal protein S20